MQVVELCLGARVDGKSIELHVEVLKRLASIIGFLAKSRALTCAHLDLLWKGAAAVATHPLVCRASTHLCFSLELSSLRVGARNRTVPMLSLFLPHVTLALSNRVMSAALSKTDLVRRTVYDIIAEIARDLPLELLDHLYSCMATLDVAEFDESTIDVVRQFTEGAVRALEVGDISDVGMVRPVTASELRRVVSSRVVSCRLVSPRVVSCRLVLCCVVLCCVVLCCVVLCCVVLCRVVSYVELV
jgi:hypothetical protein